MLSNSRAVRIEWGHCDPAGIVYYPRYFELFDASTTALFERALGMTKIKFTKAYDFIGYPMVDTQAKFHIPTRYGDDVVIETTVTEFRRSSFSIAHRLLKDGMLAVQATETRVWAGRDPNDPERIKGVPVPEEVIERFRVG
jgi:4-hydroxybenzoyl-CoA thioesterase